MVGSPHIKMTPDSKCLVWNHFCCYGETCRQLQIPAMSSSWGNQEHEINFILPKRKRPCAVQFCYLFNIAMPGVLRQSCCMFKWYSENICKVQIGRAQQELWFSPRQERAKHWCQLSLKMNEACIFTKHLEDIQQQHIFPYELQRWWRYLMQNARIQYYKHIQLIC